MRKLALVIAVLLLAGVAVSSLQTLTPAMANVAFVTANAAAPSSHAPRAKPRPHGRHQPPTHHGPPTQQHTPQWTSIDAFAGTGNETTPPVNIASQWQLVWSCDPSSDPSGKYNLTVWVKSTTSNNVDLAVNVICEVGTTSGTTLEALHGSISMEIDSPDAWSVQVQVQR